MTPPERTEAATPPDTDDRADDRAAPQPGEVVISGVDTGPSNAERGTPTPTERSERLLPTHPVSEPTDEDG